MGAISLHEVSVPRIRREKGGWICCSHQRRTASGNATSFTGREPHATNNNIYACQSWDPEPLLYPAPSDCWNRQTSITATNTRTKAFSFGFTCGQHHAREERQGQRHFGVFRAGRDRRARDPACGFCQPRQGWQSHRVECVPPQRICVSRRCPLACRTRWHRRFGSVCIIVQPSTALLPRQFWRPL